MYGHILNRHVYTFLVQDMINAAYQKPDGAEPEPSIKVKRPLHAIHNEVLTNGDSVHRPSLVIGRKRQEHSCTVPLGWKVVARAWLDRKPGTGTLMAGAPSCRAGEAWTNQTACS